MKYQWLLFDADGTLFDFNQAESMALTGTFSAFDLPFDNETGETYRQVNAQTWLEFEQGLISQQRLRSKRFERLFQALDVDLDATAFSDEYLRQLGRGTYLIPGAEALLAELDGRFKLLLITNGIPEVQRSRIAGSTIKRYFPQLIISGEVGVAKPDPKIFDAAFANMDWPAKETVLMIGDSLSSDIRGGQNYGIDTCWYNPNGRTPGHKPKPTYEIHDLGHLLSIVGS